MNYKEQIYKAWQFTQSNKRMIVWYGLLPAFVTTCVGIFYIIYQILAFKSSPLFDDAPQSFFSIVVNAILDFVQSHLSFTLPMIIGAIVLLIIYFIVPVILDAAMIQVIARRRNNHQITLGEGITRGSLRFLPLFEFKLIMRTFSVITITAQAAFILRNLGPDAFNTFLPLLILILVVGFFLHVLFTFAEYYIVIDETGVMSGIVKSCTLVILNLQRTFMLVVLMFIIAIRIIIQLVLVIIIPAIVVIGLGYFASTSLPGYGIIILASFSLLLLILASYLAAIVYVFSVAVWTFTFLDFTSQDQISAREQVEND